jgi:hypothetical protein
MATHRASIEENREQDEFVMWREVLKLPLSLSPLPFAMRSVCGYLTR